MPYRLTKIYTRKGDKGLTKIGNRQIPKDDVLIEALGTLDELNSAIGLAMAYIQADHPCISPLKTIQNNLLDCGGELYFPARKSITAAKVTDLEKWLDALNHTLPPLQEFLLPGGNPAAATLHLARTICRRAERRLVSLHRAAPLANSEIIRYINRLSDLLFVLARVLGKEAQVNEEMWDHKRIKEAKTPRKTLKSRKNPEL